jgi:hypothetical protein
MTTITLEYDAGNPEAIRLIEHVRSLPFIRERLDRREAARRLTPPCQFTIEELRERVRQSEKNFAEGNYITSAELKRQMAAW